MVEHQLVFKATSVLIYWEEGELSTSVHHELIEASGMKEPGSYCKVKW